MKQRLEQQGRESVSQGRQVNSGIWKKQGVHSPQSLQEEPVLPMPGFQPQKTHFGLVTFRTQSELVL